MLLCNPVCLLAYTYVSWKFFKHRIDDEEITLLNFFGEHYADYQKSVGTGLPFIKGFLHRSWFLLYVFLQTFSI